MHAKTQSYKTVSLYWNDIIKFPNRCVFNLDLKLVSLVLFLSLSGSSFHSLALADPKALAPIAVA